MLPRTRSPCGAGASTESRGGALGRSQLPEARTRPRSRAVHVSAGKPTLVHALELSLRRIAG
eukprot:540204-Rhodomonas_salina.1